MKCIALSIVSGLLVVVALSPHDQWWCAWFALVPLLLALRGASAAEAAAYGWVTGMVTNYGAFHWLIYLMNDFSNLGVAAYFVMALMAFYQGVPYMLWALILRSGRWMQGGWGAAATAFVSALSFPVLEFFYPIVFPWYLANTQHTQVNLTGVIELAGTGLLSLALVVVNLCVARLILPAQNECNKVWPLSVTMKGKGVLACILVLTPGICWGYSVLRNEQVAEAMGEAPKMQLGLVQPNHWIDQVDPLRALHEYQSMTYDMVREAERAGKPLDLILWPESAVRTPAPRFTSERGPSNDQDLVRFPMDLLAVEQAVAPPARRLEDERVPRWELLSIQRGHSVPILFGSTLQDMTPGVEGPISGQPALYNCGVLLDEKGFVAGIAPKVKLLLFGETIPFSDLFPYVYRLLPMASALVPGTEAIVFDYERARLGLMICYEDLLPWFHYDLARKNPEVLLNLTNDAWFGKTPEAEAHLSLAKFRSVEGRVFLVRSTPTGVSAVVDATGAVVGRIAQDEKGTLRQEVALLDIETGFERFGDTVVWGGLVLLVFYLVGGITARRRS